MDILSKLHPPAGAKTVRTRVGRGVGSGLGKTAGRGQKGQKARSKGQINKLRFEGGQTSLYRRLPKRGFRNVHGAKVAELSVGALERFDAGTTVDVAAVRGAGLVKGAFDVVKVLGNGELTKKLTVKLHGFTKSAAEKIQKAGGEVVVLEAFVAKPAVEAPKKKKKA